MRQIEEAAAKRYDLQQADSAVTKSTKEGNKAVDSAAQSLTRQQAALDRLNTGYADGSLELAKYDAVVALETKHQQSRSQKLNSKRNPYGKYSRQPKPQQKRKGSARRQGKTLPGYRGRYHQLQQ